MDCGLVIPFFTSTLEFILLIVCIGFFQRNFFDKIAGKKMGGKRKRVEPTSCKEWNKKEEVWDMLMSGNFRGYMQMVNENKPITWLRN